MLSVYVRAGDGGLMLAPVPAAALAAREALWIDLLAPSAEEEALVEAALSVDAPTAAERQAYEHSTRNWREPGFVQTAATLIASHSDDSLTAGSVVFILKHGILLTVRDIEPKAFALDDSHAPLRAHAPSNGAEALYGLLTAIAERGADVLEGLDHEAEGISNALFAARAYRTAAARRRELAAARRRSVQIRRIGFLGARAARAAESLNSLVRLAAFLESCNSDCGLSPERSHAQRREFEQMDQYARGLTDRLTFLLDAAFGLIAAEQNQSIRVMTVVSMAFSPPMLIASIYGMNFRHMPELDFAWGYPLALGVMGLSALATGLWAWRRGWFE